MGLFGDAVVIRASVRRLKPPATRPAKRTLPLTRRVGNKKYGYVVNFEQPLSHGGNIGLSGRVGDNEACENGI